MAKDATSIPLPSLRVPQGGVRRAYVNPRKAYGGQGYSNIAKGLAKLSGTLAEIQRQTSGEYSKYRQAGRDAYAADPEVAQRKLEELTNLQNKDKSFWGKLSSRGMPHKYNAAFQVGMAEQEAVNNVRNFYDSRLWKLENYDQPAEQVLDRLSDEFHEAYPNTADHSIVLGTTRELIRSYNAEFRKRHFDETDRRTEAKAQGLFNEGVSNAVKDFLSTGNVESSSAMFNSNLAVLKDFSQQAVAAAVEPAFLLYARENGSAATEKKLQLFLDTPLGDNGVNLRNKINPKGTGNLLGTSFLKQLRDIDTVQEEDQAEYAAYFEQVMSQAITASSIDGIAFTPEEKGAIYGLIDLAIEAIPNVSGRSFNNPLTHGGADLIKAGVEKLYATAAKDLTHWTSEDNSRIISVSNSVKLGLTAPTNSNIAELFVNAPKAVREDPDTGLAKMIGRSDLNRRWQHFEENKGYKAQLAIIEAFFQEPTSAAGILPEVKTRVPVGGFFTTYVNEDDDSVFGSFGRNTPSFKGKARLHLEKLAKTEFELLKNSGDYLDEEVGVLNVEALHKELNRRLIYTFSEKGEDGQIIKSKSLFLIAQKKTVLDILQDPYAKAGLDAIGGIVNDKAVSIKTLLSNKYLKDEEEK